jgi:signal transduction histidine kinase
MSKTLAVRKNSFEVIRPEACSRPVILDSWERSRITGVDPDSQFVPLRPVSQEELQNRLRINKGLVAVSIPHLEWIGKALANVPHAVYLIDQDGIVLFSKGNSSEIQQTFGLQPGFDTSERTIGTNGPGTALVVNQPIAVVGSEHFGSRFCEHATIGAPVLSSVSEILGAIGIATGISDGREHLLDLVTQSTHLISRELVYREELRRAESFKLLARVLSVTDAALAQLALDDLLKDLLNRIRKVLEVDMAAVLLKDPHGDTLVLQTSEGPRKECGRGIRVPGDKHFGRRVTERCEPTIIYDVGASEEFSPIFRDCGVRSVIGAGLVVEDWMIGAICVGTVQLRRFTENHARLLSLVADRAALAINQARSYEAERGDRIEAQATNYAKDEVLACASKRLKQLFKLTMESAQHLQSDHSPDFIPASSIETIKRNTRSQAHILENVREVFHIINGTLELNIRPVRLISVIRSAVDSVLPMSRENGISIQMIRDSANATVSGDADRLQQVLWNLLSNAIKFTPRGGRVKIILEHVDSNANITISDTGTGIGSDFLPYIFSLFPPDVSLLTHNKEQGLGLSIVRHIVELHRGTVYAESPGEGYGAAFTVSLPLIVGGLHSYETNHYASVFPGEERVPQEAFPRLNEVSVLFVDEHPDHLDSLAAVLVECGANVRASTTSALEELNDWRPEIVVSSFTVPGGGSYKLITKVKDLETARRQSIPTASLASCAVVNYWLNAPTAESQVSIPDPVEPSKLAEAVFRLVHAKCE